VIHGYGLSVAWLLEKLLANAAIEVKSHGSVLGKDARSIRFVISSRGDSSQDLTMLGELLQALHQAQDGSAREEIRKRVANSKNDNLRKLEVVLDWDGLFRWQLGRSQPEPVLDTRAMHLKSSSAVSKPQSCRMAAVAIWQSTVDAASPFSAHRR
jgi:hypothetical protein